MAISDGDESETATVHCRGPATEDVSRAMEVRQLGGALGAGIRGMDLSQPPDYPQLMVLENRPGKPGDRAR